MSGNEEKQLDESYYNPDLKNQIQRRYMTRADDNISIGNVEFLIPYDIGLVENTMIIM